MGKLFSKRNTETTWDDTEEQNELLNFLLMGKTGHGKSSLGNSILGWQAFQASDNTNSQTAAVASSFAHFESFSLKVVDGPGLIDTHFTKLTETQKAQRNMSIALTMCSEGVDAFLFVFRFGARFTREEVSVLETLKAILGNDYLKHAIVVLTFGGEFEKKQKSFNGTFDDWCKTQTGPFRELYEACDGRCVLFNNKEMGEGKQMAQREQLTQLVQQLTSRHGRYTAACFKRAASERQRMIITLKQPILKEEIQKQAGILSSKIQTYCEQPRPKQRAEIAGAVRKLKREIEKEDKCQGLLKDLMEIVEDVERNLDDVVKARRSAARLENTRKAARIWNMFLFQFDDILTGFYLALKY